MAQRVSSPDFVGRERELAILEGALDAARGGQASAVLLAGEGGVGKSRLVAELAARAERAGDRVLAGDCVDLGDAELPYAPLVAALRTLRHDSSAEELERLLGPALGALAPLLPELAAAPAPAAPLAQAQLFEALLAVLTRVAEEQPLVLVVEDLHWADRSTRDFLAFLLRNARRERLLVVLTFRSDELHRRHPLRPFLAQAERVPGVTRVDLERFTRAELAAQAAGILGAEPDPALVDELFARGEGNAFFTEELVAARESGDLLPESVRDALMLRVDALAPATQQALRAAAVAGAQVSHGLLAAAAGLPEPDLLEALREAVAHNMLVHEGAAGSYQFRHALLREVLEDDLLPGERAPLHRRIAEALEDDPSLSTKPAARAAELAFHWSLAHDVPAAFAASVRAGEEAERLSAFGEANAHYERALELLPGVSHDALGDDMTQVALLRRAAAAAGLAGDDERAAALARAAVALLDPATAPLAVALLLERVARYSWVAGHSRPALEALGEAVRLLPADAPAADRARVLGAEGHLLMLLHDPGARERLERALALAVEAGSALEEARIRNSLGAVPGDSPEAAVAHVLRARELAEAAGATDEVLRSYINLGEVLDHAGRVDEAAAAAVDGWRLAVRERMRHEALLLAAEGAGRLIRLGRWDEAAAVLDEATVAAAAGVGGGALLLADAELAALRGDAERAATRLAEAAPLHAGAIGPMWTAPLAATAATAALWSGAPEHARAIVERELGDEELQPLSGRYVAPVIALGAQAEADLAVAARALGDTAGENEAVGRSRRLEERLAPLAASAGSDEVRAYAALVRAEQARAGAEATATDWAAVAAAFEALPRPFVAAYARWREAAAALDGGEGRRRAEPPLRMAHETARELGAAPLLREVEALARRARIDLSAAEGDAAPAEPAPSSALERVGLTPRELQVLRLLAAGRTNRQIGEELYMSEKTASVHVSRILGKLDARGRVEAAGLAHRLGLLDEPAA